jgi:hypothetical protein
MERTLLMVAGVACSMLYLSGVFVAGIVTKSPYAWQCALASMGFCYMSYLGQYHMPPSGKMPMVVLVITILSIGLGVAGGVLLLKR